MGLLGSTKFITKNDIKEIKDIKIGDEVNSLNMDTLKIEIKKVNKVTTPKK